MITKIKKNNNKRKPIDPSFDNDFDRTLLAAKDIIEEMAEEAINDLENGNCTKLK